VIALPVQLKADTNSGRTLRLAGLASAVVGVIAGGLGVKFAYDARHDASVVSMHVTGAQWTSGEEHAFDDGRAKQRDMYISYVAGGALVITGSVLYYLGTRTRLEPVVSTRSAGLAIAGSF
jgi:hypothetical protein